MRPDTTDVARHGEVVAGSGRPCGRRPRARRPAGQPGDMDPGAALACLGGAARWAELHLHGVTRAALRDACAAGAVQQDGCGAYWLAGAQDAPVTRAVQLRGVLS